MAALLSIAAPAFARPIDGGIDSAIQSAGFTGVVIAGQTDASPIVRNSGPRNEGAHAIWRYASVTKQLTATIVMQEVAAGRLALDSPVKDYWPEWPAVYSDLVTVRMLLQHRSGLRDPAEDAADADGVPRFYRAAAADPQVSASGFCAEHPRAEPGVGYHYDNCDYLVLGALLEHVTGKPFAALLAERIARPLGLHLGLFAFGRPEARHVRPAREAKVVLASYGAAGGAYGTPLDLWAFDRALIDGSLLPAAARAEMWRGDPALGHAALGVWSYAARLRGCAEPVAIIERRGEIGGVQIRNFLVPETRSAAIAFTARPFAFGEVWQGKGFAYEMLSATVCAGGRG